MREWHRSWEGVDEEVHEVVKVGTGTESPWASSGSSFFGGGGEVHVPSSTEEEMHLVCEGVPEQEEDVEDHEDGRPVTGQKMCHMSRRAMGRLGSEKSRELERGKAHARQLQKNIIQHVLLLSGIQTSRAS